MTSAGVGLVAVGLGAWMVQTTRAPRTSWRADCEMAWSTIVSADVFLMGAVALLGVAVGSVFWGRGSSLLLTAPRPAWSVLGISSIVMATITIALAPGILLAMWRTHVAGAAPCLSAAAPHLWMSLAFALAVGLAAARHLNSVLAAVVAVGVVGVTYVFVPALTSRKLLNVGVTPLPMMDQRRSWVYALWMCCALLVLCAMLLRSVVHTGRWQVVGIGTALTVLALLALPVPATFIDHRREGRICEDLSGGREVCAPQSYGWLAPPAADMASRMLGAAVSAGLDDRALPSRFEFGLFGEASPPSVAQMAPTSAFAASGNLPPLEVAGLLATPSWCPEMRATQAPEALLRQTGLLAVWLAVQGGYVDRRDASSLVAPGLPDPATLTAAQASEAFAAAKECRTATWVPVTA